MALLRTVEKWLLLCAITGMAGLVVAALWGVGYALVWITGGR